MKTLILRRSSRTIRILFLAILLCTVFLLPSSALADVEGITVTQKVSLTGYHYWQLQQQLVSATDTVTGNSVLVNPVSSPKIGTRHDEAKEGSATSETITQKVGGTTRLEFDVDVTNLVIVKGNIGIDVSVDEDVYVDDLDIFLEYEESPGVWVPHPDRDGNPVVIHVITEKTLLPKDGFKDLDKVISISPHLKLGKTHRWRTAVTLDGYGKPFDGYQEIASRLWESACYSTLNAVGLSAGSGLVLSNAKVDDVVYALPSGPDAYSYSKELWDYDDATVSVDVYSALEGTYNVSSLNLLSFDDVDYSNVTDLKTEIKVPFTTEYDPPKNDPPVAVDDSATTPKDTPVDIDILKNDSDPDGDVISITGNTDPSHGTVAQKTNPSTHIDYFIYTPNAGSTKDDFFFYTISDGRPGHTSTAKVTITVTDTPNDENDPPVAVDDSATTPKDTPVDIDILKNDSDPDGDAISITGNTDPKYGTVAQKTNPSTHIDYFIYTPNAGSTKDDFFFYTISDGRPGHTSTATVTVTVTDTPDNENDPPVAVNDSATTPKDTPVDIDILKNDSDPDGDTISITTNTDPSHGKVEKKTNSNNIDYFTYTPNAGFVGTDTFTYTITDGRPGHTSTATVTVTVTERNHPDGSNDPPVAIDDHSSTAQNTPVDIDILDNDYDPDSDPISITTVTDPENGKVVVNDYDVTYTPNPGFVGTDTFTYTITDGRSGHYSTAKVTVDVTGSIPIPPAGNITSGEVQLPSGELQLDAAAAPKVVVTPRRVPAGDPTIIVKPGTKATMVYAVLPGGKRLTLKEGQPGVWKVSFLVPFKTPDGPYPIKVFVVDEKGRTSQSMYTITIDNSLPLLRVQKTAQADGQYNLKIKPLFDATTVSYFAASSNQQIILSRQSGWWTGLVPAGSGKIVATDVSGYVVEQNLNLAIVPAAAPAAVKPVTLVQKVKAVTASPVLYQEGVKGRGLDSNLIALLFGGGLCLAVAGYLRSVRKVTL